MRPHLLSMTALALAGCASSSTPEPAARPRGPDQVRTVYQPQGGRQIASQREVSVVDLEVPAAAAIVWQAVPIAYNRMGITAATTDPTHGEISTVYHRARGRIGRARISAYLDCGTGALGLPNADNYQVNFQVTTQLLPDSTDRKTTVRTIVRAVAKPDGVSGDAVPCLSTGEFERLVGAYTTEALAVVRQ